MEAMERRRRRLVMLAGAAGAAAGAAYLLYRFLALDEDTNEDRERRAERARQAEVASSAAARAREGWGGGAGARLFTGADGPEATAAVVGKKGTRWWYQAKQGVDKRASIAALQRAEQAAREETETAMTAAQDGNLEILTHLLDQGWSVDSRDKYGGTALHWAAGKGRVRVVEVLLQNKADPLARLSKGGGRGRTPLHYAARNGHLSVCKLLVSEAKVPADAMTHDSTPPLHLAVWKGRLATAEWLLSVVDNLHYVNDYGCDTSHWVAMSGDVETAKWLVAKGVTMKTANHVGHTCMHKAAQLGHLAFVKYLVEELKIDVRHVEPDGEGNSPADLAREAKHHDLAAWLDSPANRP